MRLIRLWFTKTGTARYMSHLDLNRCMIRAVRRARIPIWYTEGFNPHPFLTFALPLSLGFEGQKEIMDIKLLEDIKLDTVRDRLNDVLPQEIRILDVREPVMKPKEITFALYEIELSAHDITTESLKFAINDILSQPELIVPRRTKSGVKDFDLAPHLSKYTCSVTENGTCLLSIVLPAGSKQNLNPVVVVDALGQKLNLEADIRRIEIYNELNEIFC